MAPGKARAWCYTLNNPNDEDWTKLAGVESVYHVCGREVGKSGTKHLQGYIVYANAKSLISAKRDISERAHLEPAKGTAQHNRVYCTKEGDFQEHGALPSQGKRTDIDNVRDTVRGGGGMLEILDVCSSYQAAKFGELYLKFHEPKRSWKPKVIWLYGDTGTGKSKYIAENYPNAFWVSNAKWWCGYMGHKEVAMDDVRGHDLQFTKFLRIIDRYPMTIETKGGQRQLLFTTIIMSSPMHPRDVWDVGSENVQQLLRRIDRIIHFSGGYFGGMLVEKGVGKK